MVPQLNKHYICKDILIEISDLDSAATLLTRHYTIQNLQELSNEVLYIHVAQGTAKLLEIKFGDLKKI